MLFEHSHSHELLTPGIFDAGARPFDISVPSPDFFLADYTEDYGFPVQSKTEKYQSINDSNNFHGGHQDALLSHSDLENIIDLDDLTVETCLNEQVDIGQLISSYSFEPFTDNSPSSFDDVSMSTVEDQQQNNSDSSLPPSPPLSSISSAASSSSRSKRSKLTPVERKLRKKKQNKTAAEKYRIKKKTERDQLLDRQTYLKTSNQQLKRDLEKMVTQIQQLKQLLIDVVHVPLPLSM